MQEVPRIGENRQLVADDLVEFEEEIIEIRDCRKITTLRDHMNTNIITGETTINTIINAH